MPKKTSVRLNSCSSRKFLLVHIPLANPVIEDLHRRILVIRPVTFTTLVWMTDGLQPFLLFLTLTSSTQSTSSSIQQLPAVISNLSHEQQLQGSDPLKQRLHSHSRLEHIPVVSLQVVLEHPYIQAGPLLRLLVTPMPLTFRGIAQVPQAVPIPTPQVLLMRHTTAPVVHPHIVVGQAFIPPHLQVLTLQGRLPRTRQPEVQVPLAHRHIQAHPRTLERQVRIHPQPQLLTVRCHVIRTHPPRKPGGDPPKNPNAWLCN